MPPQAMPPETELKPLHDAAIAALNRGDLKSLAGHCQTLLRLQPDFADAWFLMSIVAAAQRNVARAIQLVDRALSLVGDNAEYLSQKAKYHALVNQVDPAVASARRALALEPQSGVVLDTLGVVFTRLGYHSDAASALARAVAVQPGNPQFHFNLAAARQILGDADAADAHFEQALAIAPDFARAHWALAELHKNGTGSSERLRRVQALQNKPGISAADELYLAHAAASELEHLGDYRGAFQQLVTGKSRRLAELNYSPAEDAALFEAMQCAFPETPAVVSSNAGGRSEPPAPLFIVGMPRSGTTLVEQVLASHSSVVSFGELQAMTHAVKHCSGTRSPRTLDAEVIVQALRQPASCVADHYRSALRYRLDEVGGEIAYFIDKMPLNFLYLGFILRSLPDARVICVRRHPLDTCLSNFRQLFAVNFSYYSYHYDLANTARYYALFHELMAHWKALFGDRLLEVSYESLTEAPEARVRAALGYLGLSWEPECLRFHEQRTAVATASAMQVREPIYNRAVGRWRRYAEQLQPAVDILEAAGIDLAV